MRKRNNTTKFASVTMLVVAGVLLYALSKKKPVQQPIQLTLPK